MDSNLIGIDNIEISYFYIKYRTRISATYLLSSKLVGSVLFYVDTDCEDSIFEIGIKIFSIIFLGVRYTYITHRKIQIKKFYLKNGDIVDYNKPIILLKELI